MLASEADKPIQRNSPVTDVEYSSPIITRRRLLGVAVLAAAVGAAGWKMYITAPDYAGDALTVAQAHKAAANGEIVLIDIRRPDEWKRTGIGEGAVPIDMRRDDFVQALSVVAGPDKAAPIALICARGVRSARMSNRLSDAGYTNIIDVPEGMLGSKAGPGWLGEKLPVWTYKEDQE